MMLIDIEPILDAAELAGKEYVSIDFLKGFEQVDAVPVVRCKECEDYNTTGCPKGFGWCESIDKCVSGSNFYCANGERKEGKL